MSRASVRSLATLSLAACLTIGCRGASLAPRSADVSLSSRIAVESYFPLGEHSQWTYRIQDFEKHWTYQSSVRVNGLRHMDVLRRDGIEVEERYSSASGPYFVEEREPILYYRENGYLNRIFLTQQGGRLVPVSGSGDNRFLPEVLEAGASWESSTLAFRVGSDLGFHVTHRHVVARGSEVVRVPAGSFQNCVRVDTYSTHGPGSGARPGEEIAFYYADWYAPGVGLVRTEQWDDAEHGRERTRIELVAYKIQPAETPPTPGSDAR